MVRTKANVSRRPIFAALFARSQTVFACQYLIYCIINSFFFAAPLLWNLISQTVNSFNKGRLTGMKIGATNVN